MNGKAESAAEGGTLAVLIGILREKFHPEGELVAGAKLRDLGLDSLDVINLLFSLEEATGVSIPDEEIAARGLATLGDFASYVDARR